MSVFALFPRGEGTVSRVESNKGGDLARLEIYIKGDSGKEIGAITFLGKHEEMKSLFTEVKETVVEGVWKKEEFHPRRRFKVKK